MNTMSSRISIIQIAIYLLMMPAFANANDLDNNSLNDLGLFKQGIQLSADGKWANAEAIFRGIAERNPRWPEAKNNLAVALYNSGKIELSHKAFDDAVTSLPSFKTAQINRQRLYDYSATLAYNKAIGNNKNPDTPKLELLNDVEDISSIIAKSKPEIDDENIDKNDLVFDQVKDSLIKWSESWSNSDVEQYLSAYSDEFVPTGKIKDYTHWKKQRSAKLRNGKIDRVSLKSIQVFVDDSKQQALAEFIQDYKANNYQDKVLKQIRLAYKNDRWLIISEQVLREIK